MGFNRCKYCGACDGRAGYLVIISGTGKGACKNCYDTLKTKSICIHTNLQRTEKEIQKTINLLAERASIDVLLEVD